VAGTFDASTVADAVDLYAGDHLGSPTLVLDTSGAIVERWYSHPFGEENTLPLDSAGVGGDYVDPSDASTRLTRRFQGRELDAETGFYDFGARIYRPDLGRFMTPDTLVPDPLRSQSFNRYAFVSNNPMRFTDPSGHGENDALEGEVELVTEIPGVDRNAALDFKVQSIATQTGLPEEHHDTLRTWLQQGMNRDQPSGSWYHEGGSSTLGAQAGAGMPAYGLESTLRVESMTKGKDVLVLTRVAVEPNADGSAYVSHDTLALSWGARTHTWTVDLGANAGGSATTHGVQMNGSVGVDVQYSRTTAGIPELSMAHRTDWMVVQPGPCTIFVCSPNGNTAHYVGTQFKGDDTLLPSADLSGMDALHLSRSDARTVPGPGRD